MTRGYVYKQSAAQERDAKRFGISTTAQLLKSPMTYRWDVIEHDALRLLKARTDLPTGSDGTARNDFINYMVGIYLNCSSVEKVPVPDSVVQLAHRQLKTWSYGKKSKSVAEEALDHARALRDQNPQISTAELSKLTGMSRRQLGRWEKDSILPRRVEQTA